MDRLSELFGNIIVITTNDVQSMNSVFGAIRRDREAAAAAAAETSATQSAPGAALVAVESRKTFVEKQGGDVEMSRDNGKILSQQRRNEELVTRSTENDKFKPRMKTQERMEMLVLLQGKYSKRRWSPEVSI